MGIGRGIDVEEGGHLAPTFGSVAKAVWSKIGILPFARESVECTGRSVCVGGLCPWCTIYCRSVLGYSRLGIICVGIVIAVDGRVVAPVCW